MAFCAARYQHHGHLRLLILLQERQGLLATRTSQSLVCLLGGHPEPPAKRLDTRVVFGGDVHGHDVLDYIGLGGLGNHARSPRREFQAWELGTWSPALERDFQEQTEKSPDGTLRYRRLPEGWQQAFAEDVKQGRYYETAITHPAIFFVARDLDIGRLKQFSREVPRELRPMAETIQKARTEQMARYQENGSHVRVVWLEDASHYLFVDRAREVAKQMSDFLIETRK